MSGDVAMRGAAAQMDDYAVSPTARSRSWAENVLQELGSPPGRSFELPGSGAASGADYVLTIAEQQVNSKRPHPAGQPPRAQVGGPAPSREPN